MSCNDKKKFKTSEASTKSRLRTVGAIDRFLNILDYPLFTRLNNKWTKDARERFGITGFLFGEVGNRAIPNKEAFKLIDNSKGIFYQVKENEKRLENLEKELVDGFLKDFNITTKEYNDLKEDIGIDSVTAADLITKSIAYQKGESILPEVAYFAFNILGKANGKLRSELRYLINKWDKYKERFDYHSRIIEEKEGFISDKDVWKNKIRDRVILDFLQEKLQQHYLNPKEFERTLDTRWTRDDFAKWHENIIQWLENALTSFAAKFKNKKEQLDNIATSIADEILNRNYQYFNYKLEEGQIKKYYNNTIDSDPFAKEMVEFGQKELNIVLTGSLALRKAGDVYRTVSETLHDIDWVVPVSHLTDEIKVRIKSIQEAANRAGAKYKNQTFSNGFMPILEELDWFKKFKEKYPSFHLIRGFVGSEHLDKFESFTITGVVDGEFYSENGAHEETKAFFKKDPETGGAIEVKRKTLVKHAKGDYIQGTGYMVDFFVRLQPNQEQHENYFKLWKEIMIAKLKMGREKDFTDWKAFVPFIKSQDSFNFNFEGFRHINFESSQNNAFEEAAVQAKETLEQTEEMPSSLASDETIAKVKEIIKKLGINIETLQSYAKKAGLDTTSINGLADIFSGIIALAEGKENVSLTEEMVHIATAIIEQTNPGMVTSMISKITRFKIYNQVFNAYKDNKNYQLANGKPNIRKIKKEAVDKLIVELIIKKSEGSTEFPELMEENERSFVSKLWTTILDYLHHIYRKTNIDIFEEAAETILSGKLGARYYNENKEGVDNIFEQNIDLLNIGTKEQYSAYLEDKFPGIKVEELDSLGSEEDIKNFSEFVMSSPAAFRGEGIYLQVSKEQEAIQKRIITTSNQVKRIENKDVEKNPLLLDEGDASNRYIHINEDGSTTDILKRVTDRVKKYYRDKFGDKTFTKEEEIFNEFKRTLGVTGHGYFEDIHGRYYDTTTGEKRAKVTNRKIHLTPREEEVYEKLETYFVNLIDTFSKDGKTPLVFSEVIVYDAKEKEAGTIDLLIVEESGKGNIIDWKFMSAAKEANDVAWYKQGAYNIQLGRYKEILRSNYGIKEFGLNRAVPILFNFKQKGNTLFNKPGEIVLKGITIGSVDTSKIEDLKLLPVSEETESTGDVLLDELLVDLNKVYRQLGKLKGTTDEEREYNKERLQVLKTAIRHAQGTFNIAPLVDAIKIMRIEGQLIQNDWEMIYDKRVASSTDSTNKELSDFSDNLREYIAISKVFGGISDQISSLIYNEDMVKAAKTKKQKEDVIFRRQLKEKISDETLAIRNSRKAVKVIMGKFADKFMGERNLTTGLLKPETIWKGLASTFRGASEAPLASIKVLFKLITAAKGQGVQDALKEVDELLAIKKSLEKRGGSLKELIQRIYQKTDDKQITNKLIYKYKREFSEELTNNALETNRSKKWFKENIDVVKYFEAASEIMVKKTESIKKLYSDDEAKQNRLILEEKQKWDIRRDDFHGWNNFLLKRFPQDKWLSEEYKEMSRDTELFSLYNFIQKINDKAVEVGYISNRISSTFIPYVRKGMAESLAWDFSLSSITNWSDSLSSRIDDIGYGSVNELTSEIENTIPKYYTTDFTVQKDKEGNIIKDEKGGALHDYSEVSEDLFKNMILYINHMEKYKYLSEIEGQILLIKTIEQFKNRLNTSKTGDIIFKEGEPDELKGNTENAKMFEDFMRAMLYEQKYPLSDADMPLGLGKATDYIKSSINKLAGKEVFKIDDKPTITSLIKTMDAVNKAFQMKTLGLEFISGAVNWFGGNIQVATQAGNYFKGRDFAKNQGKLVTNSFSLEERDTFIGLMNVFMPMKEDPTYEKLVGSGMTTLTKHNFADMLFVFMRKPEQWVEKSIFMSLLDNMMVKDGRIVSIPEFIRSKHKGRDKQTRDLIKNEIAELRKTSSITATSKMEDGKLVIPGLDMNNFAEVNRLTKLTRSISRNATGGLADADLNRMGMNIWSKSMMVFKNWIPKLVDTRFSEFRKVGDDFSVTIGEDGMTTGDKYDIGRLRLFWGFMHWNIFKTISEINNTLSVNEDGVLMLDEMFIKYSEQYKLKTGEDLNMSKDEFIDLITTNLRNQVKELTILLTMFGVGLSLGFMAPPDDKDKASKNFHRYAQKVIHKFIGELSFFYNPLEIQRMLSGSAFPAIGLFSDITRFTKHFFMETTGVDFGNLELTADEVRKKAQPIKSAARMFPVTKSLVTYIAIFNSDFAKEFDVTIQSQSSR